MTTKQGNSSQVRIKEPNKACNSLKAHRPKPVQGIVGWNSASQLTCHWAGASRQDRLLLPDNCNGLITGFLESHLSLFKSHIWPGHFPVYKLSATPHCPQDKSTLLKTPWEVAGVIQLPSLATALATPELTPISPVMLNSVVFQECSLLSNPSPCTCCSFC